MTEKNIFAYKLFLSLNISDFNLFFMWKLQPSVKKSHPPLSQQPPSKSWGPVKLPFFENLVAGSIPPPAERGDARCKFPTEADEAGFINQEEAELSDEITVMF